MTFPARRLFAAAAIASLGLAVPALAEEAPAEQKPAAAAPAHPPADRTAAKEKRFQRFDANHDGVISKEEYTAGSEAMVKRLAASKPERVKAFQDLSPADQAKRIDASFASLDANHDGRIDQPEFEKGRAVPVVPRQR